jgi:hypothetical protein
MKLLLAVAIHLSLAIVLIAGTILLAHGKPALLVGGVAVYLLGLGKVGCAAH